MGFSTLIDIVGSFIIGGMVFLILLQLNDASVDNTFRHAGDLTVQQNLVSIVELLEYDFRKIGYCSDWTKIPQPWLSIILADSNSISFLTDVESNGIVDTMKYYIGPTSESVNTPNPRDRKIYRVVNSETPVGVNLGVTQFSLMYFDSMNDTLSFPIAQPGQIYTIQVSLTVENVAAYGDNYDDDRNAFWRQIRLGARNLRNR
ncbi:MAG: hypothetical protein V1720_05990 [bacterium]